MNLLWIKRHQNFLIATGILLIIAVIAIPWWLHRAELRDLAASEAYSKAISGIRKDDPQSMKKGREELLKVVQDYASSKVAGMAQLFAASLSLELHELQEARKTYEAFLEKSPENNPLRPLALLGLQKTFEALKQPEKAKEIQDELMKLGFHPADKK